MKRLALLLLAASLVAGCEDIPTTDLGNQAGVVVADGAAKGSLPVAAKPTTPINPLVQTPAVRPTQAPSQYAPPPTVEIHETTATIQLPQGDPVTKVNGKAVGQSAK